MDRDDNVIDISAIHDPLTVEADGDRIADELIKEFKDEQESTGVMNHFAVEGKKRLKMIEDFAKAGLEDKELNDLISEYLLMAITPVESGYTEEKEHKLLDKVIAKLDSILVKQAKKQLEVRRVRNRRAIEKMSAGKLKRLRKKIAKQQES